MTERDKQEVGSKFWNKGKWDNFVLPFLPEDCSEMVLVDMGCNAGLFLALAENKGFGRVIGVDSDKEAIRRAKVYRKKIGGKYGIKRKPMEQVIDDLPAADYTVLSSAHYYFAIDDWLKYLDKLMSKTRYCVIVTVKKRLLLHKASADPTHIRDYFKLWKETGFVEPELKGDPYPRRLWGMCFKSPLLERVAIDSLDCGNHVQNGFYQELDEGKDPLKTRYYRILKRYRKDKWPKEKLIRFMKGKKRLYESVKKKSIVKPLVVNSRQRIVDGNHKHAMLKHLGYKTVLIRRVL